MRRDFTNARSNAKRRGIPFNLTFEEWAGIWLASGKWAQRGRMRGQYQMDRMDPAKGYEVGNVQVIVGADNRVKDSLNGLHGYSAILSEEDVKAIRGAYRPRYVTAPMLAEQYGVSLQCIKAIVQCRNWKVLSAA